MNMALSDAGMRADEVDYINAHGTSTKLNDAGETLAVKKVFGDDYKRVAVSSTKSMTGHLLGASGALEAVITALAVERDFLPPTVNYKVPDPECDLSLVTGNGCESKVRAAMSNSFGFGGHNAVLVIKKDEG